ncbi:MAG: hypothetical protein GTN36_02720 [Candidatus Aenigmarchaeota archaeon]|nr:hypothetical protein [Candidatus Aenigmarchaeota archaeon]
MNKKLSKDLFIYFLEWGINLNRRSIRINGSIDDDYFDILDEAFNIFELDRKKVTIRINSFGGDYYSALAIKDRIEASNLHKSNKVITEGYGKIMSAATILLVSGNIRKMSKESWFMFHEIHTELPFDRAHIQRQEIYQMNREMQQFCRIMAENSCEDVLYWDNLAKHNEVYFNADQCIELGIIDKIL